MLKLARKALADLSEIQIDGVIRWSYLAELATIQDSEGHSADHDVNFVTASTLLIDVGYFYVNTTLRLMGMSAL
jgi:hypothetical protein